MARRVSRRAFSFCSRFFYWEKNMTLQPENQNFKNSVHNVRSFKFRDGFNDIIETRINPDGSFASKAITGKAQLQHHLEEARINGYLDSRDELDPFVSNINIEGNRVSMAFSAYPSNPRQIVDMVEMHFQREKQRRLSSLEDHWLTAEEGNGLASLTVCSLASCGNFLEKSKGPLQIASYPE